MYVYDDFDRTLVEEAKTSRLGLIISMLILPVSLS